MSRVWCLKPCPGLLSVNINAYNLHFFFHFRSFGIALLLLSLEQLSVMP